MRYFLAVLTAALLVVGSWGVASASDSPAQAAQPDCETVETRLLEAQGVLDAALQNAPIGTTLENAQESLDGLLDSGSDPTSQEVIDLQSIVDAAATVDVLEQEKSTCEAPVTPPVDEDPPFESCAEAQSAGVTLPILSGTSDFSANLDTDGDGVACEVGEGTTPPPNETPEQEPCPEGQIRISPTLGCVEEVGGPAPDSNDDSNDTLNPSQFTDVPNTSRGVDTGGL